MVLNGSGALSFTSIQTEFGGTNPISLSEYYTNAAGQYTNGVSGLPATGAPINVTAFYGKAKLTFAVNYSYSYTNAPYIPGTTASTSIIWYGSYGNSSGYWTGAGTPSWLCEYSPQNQSANKIYEYIYYSSSPTDVSCQFAFQCDNRGGLYLNNTLIASNTTWTATTFVTASLKYGNNRIYISCTNDDPGGAGGCIMSCKRVSDNAVLFTSSSSWRMN